MKESDVDNILAELKSILLKKQQDYGPLNISNSPGGPLNGLRVRMFDKLARFNNLYDNGNDTPNYESLNDTFIDLANYAIIGILVQNGQWEGLPSTTPNRSTNVKDKAESYRHNPRPPDSVPPSKVVSDVHRIRKGL